MIEELARRMFVRQAATWDLIEAAANVEWEADGDLRAFWICEVGAIYADLTQLTEKEAS